MTKIDTTRLPKLIALCGLEGAGKSEAAKCLRVAYGYTIRSFAGPIKAYLSALGVPHASLYGTPEQKAAPIPEFGGKSGRDLMVGLGEYTARMLGPTVFARAAKRSRKATRFGWPQLRLRDSRITCQVLPLTGSAVAPARQPRE